MKRCLVVPFIFVVALLAPAADPPAAKVAPLGVNSEREEDDPHVSSDDLRLYYTVKLDGHTQIWMAARKKPGEAWGPGKALDELQSKTADFRSPFVTAEGVYPQKLFYASNREPEKAAQTAGNYDIYFYMRQLPKSDWTFNTAIVPIGSEADELHPWLAGEGRYLYFSRKDKDGWRQYVSSRPADGGQYGPPSPVGLPVGFHHATLTPDSKTMFVQGPVELNGERTRWGIFRSIGNGKSWTKPQPALGLDGSGGTLGDLSPNLSRDGLTLYFASDRPGGKGGLDLYSIPTGLKKK